MALDRSSVTPVGYPGRVTQLSRALSAVAVRDPRGCSKFDRERISWFLRVQPIVSLLHETNPEIPVNDLWAASTHLVEDPGSSSHLRAIGIVRRPSGLPEILDHLRQPLNRPHPETKRKANHSFTFMDLFAGIGGFNLALTRAGGHCVFSSEWNDSARLTYAMNFGIVPFGDIRGFTRVNGAPASREFVKNKIPNVDVIAAGFPCQPFSQAGVSSRNYHGGVHGLQCEAEGTLFEDILVIARAIKPKVLLLENVSNLARHDKGRTFQVIAREIEKSGYVIFPNRSEAKTSTWAVIDSQAVVAQRRKRVYIVCVRSDLVRETGMFQFPKFEFPRKPFALSEVIANDDSFSDEEKFAQFSISKKLWKSHLAREAGHREKGNGFRIGLVDDLDGPAPTLVARYFKDGKDCLIPNQRNPKLPPRMLSPRECAALQTFPSSFWIPEFRTPAYKQFGNSITVEVATRIAAAIARTYL